MEYRGHGKHSPVPSHRRLLLWQASQACAREPKCMSNGGGVGTHLAESLPLCTLYKRNGHLLGFRVIGGGDVG